MDVSAAEKMADRVRRAMTIGARPWRAVSMGVF
jgi:hypothetical protein